MDALSDEKIIDSWEKNVSPWVIAIRNKQIDSRIQVTDKAIIETILSLDAKTVLDIGCGEGWLARELVESGLGVTGIDAVEELVSSARKLGQGNFQVLKYEEISTDTISGAFDVAVCNFSLLGKESVEHIFDSVSSLLNPDGYFVIQTLHPQCFNEEPYMDGWRKGSWTGFNDEFCDPAPWYFRTTESWLKLIDDSGLELKQIKEPINSKTGDIVSLILIASQVKTEAL